MRASRRVAVAVGLLVSCGGDPDDDGHVGFDSDGAADGSAGSESGGDGGGGGAVSDACPADPDKDAPGVCGCGIAEDDTDEDGSPDCIDACPDDANKVEAGTCGCGVPDADGDLDGVLDCLDNCSAVANEGQADDDDDGVGDSCDNCAVIPNPGQDDADADGTGEACACDPTPIPCSGEPDVTYACDKVEMLARLDLEALDASVASDLWGWTSPETGREYALLGVNHGTVFVDLTYPYCPRHVGTLPTHSGNGPLRDIKVAGNYAFIVAEAEVHGMQVFDLRRLENAVAPETFDADAHYALFGNAHNLALDPVAGFAYAVGTQTCNGGGPHIIDVTDPLNPAGAGCFSDVGYVHDAQCLTYAGPDTEHQGKQLCVVFNGGLGSVSVVDMTDKEAIVEISRTDYSGASFAHQGWLTEDHAYLLHNDEFDESNGGHFTRTYIWDFRDLDAPEIIDFYEADSTATDHNLFTHQGYAYQANYRAGVRIFDLADVAQGELSQVAYFDTDPTGDGPQLEGAFSVFPYYASGLMVVSDLSRGVFVLRAEL
ncbi:MAG: choice-of-anchor B family protein [Myxococcota bacterium]